MGFGNKNLLVGVNFFLFECFFVKSGLLVLCCGMLVLNRFCVGMSGLVMMSLMCGLDDMIVCFPAVDLGME